MPKTGSNKRKGASQSSPYDRSSAKTKGANNLFKLNTNIGQHVLKNPGVAQAIVDKADLKQSDVSFVSVFYKFMEILSQTNILSDRPGSRPRHRKFDRKDFRESEKGHRG